MRALVTGNFGFIGSNLFKRLLSEGWKVDGVDDLSGGHVSLLDDVVYRCIEVIKPTIERLPPRVTLNSEQRLRGDIEITTSTAGGICFISDFADPDILQRISAGKYDVIFHQAAVPRVSYSVEHPDTTTDCNVLKTVQLLTAARDVPGIRVVFASSSSVYGGADILPTKETEAKQPKSPYALQKSVCEEFCSLFSSLYGLETVCLRYFNVFGPGQLAGSPYSTAVSAWCHAIKNGQPLRSDGDGTQTRDMCYVDNVVEMNIRAATHPGIFQGTCFNVACGDSVSNGEILSYLKGRFPHISIQSAPWRPGDVMHTRADISRAVEVFGYEPKVRFWEGLERTLSFWNL